MSTKTLNDITSSSQLQPNTSYVYSSNRIYRLDEWNGTPEISSIFHDEVKNIQLFTEILGLKDADENAKEAAIIKKQESMVKDSRDVPETNYTGISFPHFIIERVSKKQDQLENRLDQSHIQFLSEQSEEYIKFLIGDANQMAEKGRGWVEAEAWLEIFLTLDIKGLGKLLLDVCVACMTMPPRVIFTGKTKDGRPALKSNGEQRVLPNPVIILFLPRHQPNDIPKGRSNWGKLGAINTGACQKIGFLSLFIDDFSNNQIMFKRDHLEGKHLDEIDVEKCSFGYSKPDTIEVIKRGAKDAQNYFKSCKLLKNYRK